MQTPAGCWVQAGRGQGWLLLSSARCHCAACLLQSRGPGGVGPGASSDGLFRAAGGLCLGGIRGPGQGRETGGSQLEVGSSLAPGTPGQSRLLVPPWTVPPRHPFPKEI